MQELSMALQAAALSNMGLVAHATVQSGRHTTNLGEPYSLFYFELHSKIYTGIDKSVFPPLVSLVGNICWVRVQVSHVFMDTFRHDFSLGDDVKLAAVLHLFRQAQRQTPKFAKQPQNLR